MNHRILVIDDNPSIHDDIKKILRTERPLSSDFDLMDQELFGDLKTEHSMEQKFEIDSAFQGKEGLEMVKRAKTQGQPYMMAFVDVRMPPGWDGIETIHHLWQIDKHLQIVLCTAFSDYSWNDIVAKLGPSDALLIIKKPFDNIEVMQVAHALTRKWMLHNQVQEYVDTLEDQVRIRTQDLTQINNQLMEEITHRKMAEERLKFMATHDSLTHLPNRILLHDRLKNCLARARRFHHHVALLLLDLDQFKTINDTYGHSCGDNLLKIVSERLIKCVRECDTVARMGGDEFIILLGDLSAIDEAEQVAKRIIAEFEQPFVIEQHSFNISTSIGISYFPTDCHDIETLLKSADVAMYWAKDKGGATYCLYRMKANLSHINLARVKELLNSAVDKNELELYYQPLINLSTAELSGMEALCRWKNPELGLMEPMKFIPLAEESGLIVPMGEWIMRTACEQNKAWQRQGFLPIPIAVNVSARQFIQLDLVDTIQRILEETELEPGFLEVEITESTMMLDLENCRRKLQRLYSLGVQIVVDDFGSGYSSLNRLKSLPIHGIKIDRFFLQNIVDDKRDAAIVLTIIALAHSLQIRVIAEGIETTEQLNFLKTLRWDLPLEMSCAKGQGFLFSKPVPAKDAVRFFHVKTWNRK